MDADVDPREGDERREEKERRDGTAREQRERDGAREARRRVPGRKRRPDRSAEERVCLREPLERARAVDGDLERRREEVGGPDGGRRDRGRRHDGPTGGASEERCERDPEEPGVADEGEGDEDRVEEADAVLDDPKEEMPVGGRGSQNQALRREGAGESTREAARGRTVFR